MMWRMRWLNKSVATVIATLQFLDIYIYIYVYRLIKLELKYNNVFYLMVIVYK